MNDIGYTYFTPPQSSALWGLFLLMAVILIVMAIVITRLFILKKLKNDGYIRLKTKEKKEFIEDDFFPKSAQAIFPDENLAKRIWEVLNNENIVFLKSVDTPKITKMHLEAITKLHASGRKIKSVEGLYFLKNCVEIDLSRNEITNFRYGPSKIEYLDLSYNIISGETEYLEFIKKENSKRESPIVVDLYANPIDSTLAMSLMPQNQNETYSLSDYLKYLYNDYRALLQDINNQQIPWILYYMNAASLLIFEESLVKNLSITINNYEQIFGKDETENLIKTWNNLCGNHNTLRDTPDDQNVFSRPKHMLKKYDLIFRKVIIKQVRVYREKGTLKPLSEYEPYNSKKDIIVSIDLYNYYSNERHLELLGLTEKDIQKDTNIIKQVQPKTTDAANADTPHNAITSAKNNDYMEIIDSAILVATTEQMRNILLDLKVVLQDVLSVKLTEKKIDTIYIPETIKVVQKYIDLLTVNSKQNLNKDTVVNDLEMMEDSLKILIASYKNILSSLSVNISMDMTTDLEALNMILDVDGYGPGMKESLE